MNQLSGKIIQCAKTVYKELGPGFAECIYHRAFAYELQDNGFKIESKRTIPIQYKEYNVGFGEADIVVHDECLVENRIEPCLIIVELKAIAGNISEKEKSQINTYRKNINGVTKGLIINFPQPSTNTVKEEIDYLEIE